MKMIQSVPLTKESFAPFGKIIAPPGDIPPAADGPDFSFTPVAAPADLSGTDMFANLLCKHRPFVINKMERHIETAEMLCALSGDSLLCVAEPAVGPVELSAEDLKAFIIRQSRGVLLKPGCWHWIPFPLQEEPSNFLLLFKDGTGENDLEFAELPEEYGLATG